VICCLPAALFLNESRSFRRLVPYAGVFLRENAHGKGMALHLVACSDDSFCPPPRRDDVLA
jgi:hypothetical protein